MKIKLKESRLEVGLQQLAVVWLGDSWLGHEIGGVLR
jgi:hypothetical protein